uniref:Uncharacterized protein n=1 Tax=Arundo donax TaxID=35708 RepID=A0A0A9HIT2_ARUDO
MTLSHAQLSSIFFFLKKERKRGYSKRMSSIHQTSIGRSSVLLFHFLKNWHLKILVIEV